MVNRTALMIAFQPQFEELIKDESEACEYLIVVDSAQQPDYELVQRAVAVALEELKTQRRVSALIICHAFKCPFQDRDQNFEINVLLVLGPLQLIRAVQHSLSCIRRRERFSERREHEGSARVRARRSDGERFQVWLA